MLGSLCEISGESLGRGDAVSSQSPRSTDAVIVAKAMNEARSAASKTAPREGGQEGGSVKAGTEANRLYETKATAVSEGAKHVADPHPANRWKWAEASVWTERMVSALDNGVKGCKATQWFGLMDKVERPSTLAAAWQRVARNGGAAGVDRQSIERFAADSEGYLSELSQSLRDRSYRPQAVKRVEIPRHDGKTRPLGIPTVKDRIVQTALKFVLEPIFEAQFLEASYGFRPGLSCKDALREVDGLLKDGYHFVVDADLQSYFDSIPHAPLMQRIEERISDGAVLALIERFLKADIVQEAGRWTPTGGTPQGAVISPLLANVYLHPLDVLMKASQTRMVRYADDFVILCRTRREADAALERVRGWVQTNGLTLHPDKTHVGDARQPGEGFEFLGYRFEAGRTDVRKKSLERLKARIKQHTRRTRGVSLACIVSELNRLLKGWCGYFKHAHKHTFGTLDGQIRRRLRALLRKQEKRPGFGRNYQDHQRWPNAYFAEAGLFALHTAWQNARQPR